MGNERLQVRSVLVYLATVAAGTDATLGVWRAPVACEVVGVYLFNDAALTGHATIYTTVALIKQGGNNIASRAIDTVTTDNVTADRAWEVTLTTTVADKKLAAGGEVQVTKTDTSTGMAITNATLQIDYIIGYED